MFLLGIDLRGGATYGTHTVRQSIKLTDGGYRYVFVHTFFVSNIEENSVQNGEVETSCCMLEIE